MNPNTDRRGEFVAALGGLLSLTTAVVIWLVALYGRSPSVLGLGFVSFGGLLVWIVSYAQLHQRRLLEEERFELAELERDRRDRLGGSKTIFDESDLQQMDALAMGRRLRTLERWFVPVGGLLAAAFWTYAGLRLLPGPLAFRTVADSADTPVQNVAVLASFTAGAAFLSFLVSRWAIVLARIPAYHLLRAGGNAMFGITVASLLTTAGLIGVSAFGAARLERGAGIVLAVLMLVLAAETVINFILDFYRPRIAGVVQRSFFDSRVLGMFSEPGGVLKSLADAVDYQFGFKVSETWFYQLLGRWITPLLLAQAGLLWLITGVVVVPQGFEAVIEHFRIGDAAVSVVPSGIKLKWPWPIDRATLISAERIQRFEIGYDRKAEESGPPRAHNEPELWTKAHRKTEYELLVPDRGAAADESLPLNLISVTIPIQWRVKPGATQRYHANARDVPELVEALAYRVLTRFAGQADVRDLLSAGGATTADRIRDELQQAVDQAGVNGSDLGVEIVHVSLANVHPATGAADAYEETIAAYQKKETLIREAEGKADQERVEAGGLAYQTIYDGIVAEEEAREAARQAEQAGDAAAAQAELRRRTEAVEHLLRTESGGEARAIVAQAERRAFAKALGEAARAELYQIQSQAYRQAPEIYRLRRYLQAVEAALGGARKYVLALRDNQRVRIIYDDGAPVEAGLIQSAIQGLRKE